MVSVALRFTVLAILFVILSTSSYFRRKARESGGVISRREEGALALFIRMAAVIPLILAILLNIFYPLAMSWSKVSIPTGFHLLGIIAALISVPLVYWVFKSIGRNISETVLTKEDHELVMHGPYKWVRHPLYSSTLLLLLSISLIFGDVFIFLYAVMAMIVFQIAVIPSEEKKLVELFGKEYEDYRTKTGALFPKFSK